MSQEHEPASQAEPASQPAASDAGDFEGASGRVRSALRPGFAD